MGPFRLSGGVRSVNLVKGKNGNEAFLSEDVTLKDQMFPFEAGEMR
jgi:hypothetical protein